MLEFLLSLCLFLAPMGEQPLPTEKAAAFSFLSAEDIATEDLIDSIPLSHIPRMKIALREVSQEEQLLDKRETWVCGNDATLTFSLEVLRQRYQDLKDAPKVEDSYYWVPDEEVCQNCVNFNRAFHNDLQQKMIWEMDRATFYQIVLEENDELYEKWICLRGMSIKTSYINETRYYLKKYKKLATKEEWENKTIPPEVPIWRFYEKSSPNPPIPVK